MGQAHLFDATTGNLLHTFDDPTVTSQDFFGWSVAVEGNKVLVGAIGDDTNGDFAGQAHVFDAITGNLLQTLNDPTPSPLYYTVLHIGSNKAKGEDMPEHVFAKVWRYFETREATGGQDLFC